MADDGRILSTKAISIRDPGNDVYPFQRRVIFNDPEKKKEVIEDFERIIQHWEGQGNLRSKLQQFQNDSEGISDPPQSPWPDSSAIVKPIIETRQNIIHSFFMSLVRPLIGKLFTCSTSFKATEEERQVGRLIAAFFNNHREFVLAYVDSLDEAFWALLTDGTVGRSCDWLRKVEVRWERKKFTTLDDLVNEFPTPDSLGVSDGKYMEYVATLQAGMEISLDLEREVVTEDRPHIDFELLKDVLIYPITASKQEKTQFIGKALRKRAAELQSLVKAKLYTKSVVDAIVKITPGDLVDSIEQQRNQIAGVYAPAKKEDYLLIHGRYFKDLDGDGIEEKYLVTYSPEAKDFPQFDRYPFWHNQDNVQLSWFKRRAKGLIGRGVAEMLSDTQLEATIQARFRINSNSITNAPVILVNDALKNIINPGGRDGSIRPGRAYYIPEGKWDKAVKAFEFPKRDFGDALKEEANLDRMSDNLIGASELRSGRETPSDPRAPAAKTALLLEQSGHRLDDFVFGFILRENKILDMAKKLYYQFGPEKIQFNVEEEGQISPEEIQSSWFNSENIHLQLSVTSLMDNPDFLAQKWEEFFLKYGPEPLLGAIPEVRHTMLKQIIDNKPEAQGKRLLLPLQMIQQMAPPVAPAGPDGSPAPGVNPTLESALTGARR